MRGFSSLRVRLIGLLTAVVVTAMGVVFLYVVPTLRANLISQRLNTLADRRQSPSSEPAAA